MPLQQWDLPLKINVSLNGCELVKNHVAQVHNAYSRCFFDKVKSWWAKDIDKKNSVRYFILVGGVWWTITQIWLNDATAVIFSVKCFNPLKLSSIRKHLKRFASYFLFIHEHLIKYWFSTVNLIAVTTVLLTFSLHRCYQRIFKEKMNKCVSRTDTNPPFAFQAAFPRGTDFTVFIQGGSKSYIRCL